MVSERQIQKELNKHPWATREIAERIARDNELRKTTTKEGKRAYMKDYMRDFRKRQRQQQLAQLPSLSQAIGLSNLTRSKKK
jgi:hypothetical protein